MQNISYDNVRDPIFLKLWHEVCAHGISWERFQQLPMPEGANPGDVWNAISILRQWCGEEIGFNEDQSVIFWTNISTNGRQKLHYIMKRGEKGSIIERYVSTFGYQNAFIELQIESLRSAMSFDGHRVGYEVVRSIATGAVQPRTAVERVVENYFDIIFREVGGKMGPSDSQALFSELTQGVADVPNVQWNTRVLKNLSRSLANVSQASDEVVFSTVRYIWGAGRDLCFVSAFQSVFASLLKKVYLIRSGHPCLSFIPLSARLRTKGAPHAVSSSYDMSQGVEQLLDVMVDALDELEMIAKEELGRLESAQGRVAESPLFNYRQKALLDELLVHPGASFDYRTLKDKFNVSYNTVRNDVSQLMQMGLLFSCERGGCTVVYGVPSLIGAIELMR